MSAVRPLEAVAVSLLPTQASLPALAAQAIPAPEAAPRLQVRLARSEQEVRAIQRLRYQVFHDEMGAEIIDREGLDRDQYDPYCQHLYVYDTLSERIAGCTRLLDREAARRAGGFYSQGEFLMDRIAALSGAVLEIGRTCIHADYRDGRGIGMLWQGLAEVVAAQRIDFLFGCASVPMKHESAHVHALMARLRERYLCDDALRVQPFIAVPPAGEMANVDTPVPPLLKAYLRLGAKICGEPAWDEQFGVADLFVLLHVDDLAARYARHFLAR